MTPGVGAGRYTGGVLAAWVVAGLACAPGGEGTGENLAGRARDGDAPLVWSSGPSWAPGDEWRIGGSALVEVGKGGPGDPTYSNVSGAVLHDAGFVVANLNAPPEVRFYDSTGALVRAVGGDGEGPGEFRQILRVWRLDDGSLLSVDLGLRRLTRFAPDGELAEMTAIPMGPADVPGGSVAPFTAFGDGTVVALPNMMFPPGTTGQGWSHLPLLAIRPDGSSLDTLGTFPAVEFAQGTHGRPVPRPYGGFIRFAAFGDRLFHGTGAGFEITERTPDGRRVRSFGRDDEARPLTAELLDRFKEARREAVGDNPDLLAGVEQQFARMIPAETLPAYREIMADRAGNVWALSYPVPGDTVRWWSIFDRERRYLGRVSVPSAFRVRDADEDRVLGVWTGEYDEETVRVYRLLKPGG